MARLYELPRRSQAGESSCYSGRVPNFSERTTLDGVVFNIHQKQDPTGDALLMVAFGVLYASPLVVIVLVVLLLVGGSYSVLVGLLSGALAIGGVVTGFYLTRARDRMVSLEIRPGMLLLDDLRLPLTGLSVLIQRLDFSESVVLTLTHVDHRKPILLGGLRLSPAQQQRIEVVIDQARRNEQKRQGGTVPAALQRLRE